MRLFKDQEEKHFAKAKPGMIEVYLTQVSVVPAKIVVDKAIKINFLNLQTSFVPAIDSAIRTILGVAMEVSVKIRNIAVKVVVIVQVKAILIVSIIFDFL